MQTMINTYDGASEYPIRSISDEVILCIDEVCKELNIFHNNNISSIKRTLDCYLQLTDQVLDKAILKSPQFVELCIEYYGAIYDPNLFQMKCGRRYVIIKTFNEVVKKLVQRFEAFPIPSLKFSSRQASEDAVKCISAFQKKPLNEENLWIWRAWPCHSKVGNVTWPNLLPIYERLGRKFTDGIYQACSNYISGRDSTSIPCIKPLVNFISTYPEPLNAEDFNRPEFTTRFWREFLKYYMITEYAEGKGSAVTTLCTTWRNRFKFFVETYLNQSGFIAKPWGEFPLPPIRYVIGPNSNVTVNANGDLIKTKLLTDIPLNITDEDALKLLFKQIRTDVDIATEWADWEVNDIWKRYEKRIANSSKGQIVTKGATTGVNNGNRWLISRKNPEHLIHASRTLNERNHILTQDAVVTLPRPISQTAYELAMPITGTFLPHCVLLIANHPTITSSFLENLELYDKHGRMIGFVESDGHYKLISVKKRRGSKLAQQIIVLNEYTTEIVKQIIALTAHTREYLKQNKDDDWRYLLITCGRGFAYPTKVTKLASDTDREERVSKIIDSLQNSTNLSFDESTDYMRRFCLSSLRASAAVLIYLKTQSISEFSKALGHAEVDHDLIQRYLPEPILAFFQDRWIRIFQTAIIVEALNESEFLLEASGLENIDELDEFLKLHALKLPPSSGEILDQHHEVAYEKNQILFGVNSIILTLLLSLQQAVEQAKHSVHAKAVYWAELSKFLISYIEQNETHRPDLQNYLEEAKKHTNPSSMERLIYD